MVEKSRTKTDGSTLIFDGSVKINFDASIINVLEFSTCVVVLVDHEELKSNLNIFSFDYDGKKLWQVEKFLNSSEDFQFVGILKTADGYARLFNFDSFVRTVDPCTGELIKTEFVK
jgi:hypothetical protein